MKIALISPYDFPYPGGVTEHMMALARQLKQRGHQIQILAASSGYQGQTAPDIRPVTRRVTTIPIAGATARVGLSPLGYVRLKSILCREAFDVLHLHEPLTPSLTWYALLLTRQLPQTVTVGTFHAYHERPNWLYARGRPIFSRFFARLDSLIAVSEVAGQFAGRMFPGDYRIIPNGIDLSRFTWHRATGQPRDHDSLTILFVGRLDRRKGFVYLLEAFLQLKALYPRLRLQVVGPFTNKEAEPLKNIALSRGITDVDFAGYVTPEALPLFYQQADIFCAPALGFESFGMVLLEAMAAGLPVVASNIAGYRSLLVEGQEGWLTPPGQPLAIAAALRRLIDNPALRSEMGWRGRLKAQHYSWDYLVDEVLEVYHETMARKRNRSSGPVEVSVNSSQWPAISNQ
jgi:phosphatidylinositol alpha-mannosyltransferase